MKSRVMHAYTAIIAVLAALCLEGCAMHGQAPQVYSTPSPPTVTVTNRTTAPLRVFLQRKAATVLLGTVRGLSSRTLPVAGGLDNEVGDMALIARDRGGAFVIQSDPFTFGLYRAMEWHVDPGHSRIVLR